MLPNECYEVLLDKGPRSPDLGGWHKASLGTLTERGLVYAQQRRCLLQIQDAQRHVGHSSASTCFFSAATVTGTIDSISSSMAWA